jgi:hypothetical protein
MTTGSPSSAYETWVRRLRQWQRDPATPLDDLPVLEHDTFTPATYQRLLTHIEKALEAVTTRWSERLSVAFRRNGAGHDLARDLVAIRPLLARRVQLATHPHLPEALRGPLQRDCTQTLTRLQEELEEMVKDLRRDGKLRASDADELLRTVRENSLVRVLNMHITQDGRSAVASAVDEDSHV